MLVGGNGGALFTVQASTNLAGAGNWAALFTTNSPPLPFRWTDSNPGNLPQRFYRVLIGP